MSQGTLDVVQFGKCATIFQQVNFGFKLAGVLHDNRDLSGNLAAIS